MATSLADDLEKVRIDVSDFVAELKKGIECRTYEDEKNRTYEEHFCRL